MMKKAVAGLMVVFSLVFLVACGGGSVSPAGTYKMKSITMGGSEMSVKDLATIAGVSEDIFKLTINEDGTFTMVMALGSETQEQSGTWKASGKTLTLTVDGSDQTAEINGKQIIMTDSSGIKVVFEK